MTVKTLDLAEATGSLADFARQADHQTTVVTCEGTPIAVVVPIDNADLETITLSQNPQFLAIIERSRICHEREGGISSDEMRRRLGLASDQPKLKQLD